MVVVAVRVPRKEFFELEPRDKEQVDNFQNPQRVDHEQNNKPPVLSAAPCVPQSQALPQHRPQNGDNNKRCGYRHCKEYPLIPAPSRSLSNSPNFQNCYTSCFL